MAVDELADRLAQRALAKRSAGYAAEVRKLLDAALEVMRACGTESRPRVADIVAAAGLSNDAFYRHFRSKDALVEAILTDGAERLRAYVDHQMGKAETPAGKVRRWVDGILSQTSGESAATTRAVLWNAGNLSNNHSSATGPPSASGPLAGLLRGPFAALGSDDPDFAATLAAHAIIGKLSDYLWSESLPDAGEIDRITAFCLRAAEPGN